MALKDYAAIKALLNYRSRIIKKPIFLVVWSYLLVILSSILCIFGFVVSITIAITTKDWYVSLPVLSMTIFGAMTCGICCVCNILWYQSNKEHINYIFQNTMMDNFAFKKASILEKDGGV